MKKKTFISVLVAIFIVFISFLALIFFSNKGINELLVSLCEALFTGGVVSIIPQLIDWHSSESDFSESLHIEFLSMLEWAQAINFEKKSCKEIQDSAYNRSQALLKLQGQYVFSYNVKRIKNIRKILFNFTEKIKNNDLVLATRIIDKDLIPELKTYVEPKS